VLDALVGHLLPNLDIEEIEGKEDLTFYNILFTYWAHGVLERAGSVAPLGMEDARALFKRLRSKDSRMPYRMRGYKQKFVDYFLVDSPVLEQEEKRVLAQTLALLWEEFRQEYQWIKTEDLDPRFSKFVRIRPSP